MTPPRFTADQVAILLRLDPAATYHPPSRPGAADDFLELSDGTALPNPARAADWIRTQPSPAPARACARPGRPRLTLITGGRPHDGAAGGSRTPRSAADPPRVVPSYPRRLAWAPAGSRDRWRLPVPAFQGPIHIDPDAAARAAVRIAGEVRCTCRTPFCRGQDSADWLTCERSCRACRPRPFQPPTRTAAGLEAPTIEGTSGGVDDG